ncbi:hypothetical protein DB88DRAFT_453174 [Papiliotrema laurentii]|uniref:Diphthamide biosynthesis protein 3 n=1 Tax=Papiliotrema laurentii TaxID=5418 RepID=A0AAD9D0Y1_PAPLA|nr:hypothetical protein DB88DRAFT_453174 [Papiliotrema laurentii]
MVTYYDELEIEDFSWDPVARVFHYPCPCGDRFEISKAQLRDGEEIATCPSCSLIVRVIYDYLDWEDYATTDEEDEASEEEDVEVAAPGTTEPAVAATPLQEQNDQDITKNGDIEKSGDGANAAVLTERVDKEGEDDLLGVTRQLADVKVG